MNQKMVFSSGVLAIAAMFLAGCESTAPAEAKAITTQTVNGLKITLANASGELSQGNNQFQMMFRSADTDQPVDVGNVMVSCSMGMPGMAPMVASVEMKRGETGQYLINGNFGMSGSWTFDVQWDGPAGQGSAMFHSSVR